MTYYPVYIPTLNRYEHFRNCVESLARCTHADKTELVVGLDYPPSEKYVEGWKKIKAYLPTLQTLGFGKVTVFEHKENLGQVANPTFLWNYCAEHYSACIVSEDDNVFSPNFLDFMNQALERYADDPKIVSVCGYSQAACECPNVCKSYLSYDACAWGMGMWCNKHRPIVETYQDSGWEDSIIRNPSLVLKILWTYPYLLLMLWRAVKDGRPLLGDMKRTTYNFRYGTWQLRPARSLVRNCGVDGSGLTWGGDIYQELAQQPISKETTFDFGTEYPRPRNKGLFFQSMKATSVYFAYLKLRGRFMRR